LRTISIADSLAARLRAIGGIGVLTATMLAGTAGVAQAASVTPTPVNSGNPTCDDFDAGWTQLKIDGGLGNGTFTDGTLEVTISNFQNSSSPTPGSFDWSSNIGVDAVFVKAGSDKHNLFVYSPESKGDTDLGPQAGQGNGISHISFCYDDDGDVPPPPGDEEEPPVDEPPSEEPPSDEPTPTPDVPSTPDDPTPAPSGDVQGVTGTPAPTLPSTDTLSSGAGSTGSGVPVALVVLTVITIGGVLTVRMPSRSRR
jgi:hypothetical protein